MALVQRQFFTFWAVFCAYSLLQVLDTVIIVLLTFANGYSSGFSNYYKFSLVRARIHRYLGRYFSRNDIFDMSVSTLEFQPFLG